MDELRPETETSPAAAPAPVPAPRPAGAHPTDRPIPLFPEGLIVVAAAVALLVIGLRHRVWIERKVKETQRAVEEFQRQGGMEDLTAAARQAGELFRGS